MRNRTGSAGPPQGGQAEKEGRQAPAGPPPQKRKRSTTNLSELPVGDKPEPAPPPGRLAYRLVEVAGLLGVSRRHVERQRAAGKFPRPDLHMGKAPLWRPETIRRWVEGGGS